MTRFACSGLPASCPKVVAVCGNLDLGGDIIHPGAFAKTIAEQGTKVRCLDNHNTDSILRVLGKTLAMREIGREELPPELLAKTPAATGGLWVRTKYLLDTPEGKGAFIRIKEGAIDEYSSKAEFRAGAPTKEQKITVRRLAAERGGLHL